MNINVAVEASPSIIDKMVDSPNSDYRVKLIQRDATYLGDIHESHDVSFIFKIYEYEKTSSDILMEINGHHLTRDDVESLLKSNDSMNGGYTDSVWSMTNGDVFASGRLVVQD